MACELVFDPLSFIGRLLALIPRPRLHMLRYAGVLGPDAKLRQQVVPAKTAQSQRAAVQLTLVELGSPCRKCKTMPRLRPDTRRWPDAVAFVRDHAQGDWPRVVSSGAWAAAAPADSSPARCRPAAVVRVCVMPILGRAVALRARRGGAAHSGLQTAPRTRQSSAEGTPGRYEALVGQPN
jgi:hypothetical protein